MMIVEQNEPNKKKTNGCCVFLFRLVWPFSKTQVEEKEKENIEENKEKEEAK